MKNDEAAWNEELNANVNEKSLRTRLKSSKFFERPFFKKKSTENLVLNVSSGLMTVDESVTCKNNNNNNNEPATSTISYEIVDKVKKKINNKLNFN